MLDVFMKVEQENVAVLYTSRLHICCAGDA